MCQLNIGVYEYRRGTRGTPHAKARAAGGGSKSTAIKTSMSEIRERKREEADGEHTSRQNASISRAITYLNAVPVISCCPLFDNNLRPPATTRFLATATNENRNKTRAREQLCALTDYGYTILIK